MLLTSDTESSYCWKFGSCTFWIVTPKVSVLHSCLLSFGYCFQVVMDRQKRVFTWGFGGYGRLGHAEQKDELVPRLVKIFDGPNKGAVMIQAGSTFSMAVNEWGRLHRSVSLGPSCFTPNLSFVTGGLYFWGQNKSTGEATMYPKPVLDLNGWKIRSFSCWWVLRATNWWMIFH